MQGMAGYVFPNFYGSAAAQSTASLLSSVLILLVCAPFASKLASRFGKKELATVSCIVAAVLEVICFVLKPANVWVYVGFFCAAFICLGFFNTIIWAMITVSSMIPRFATASVRTAPSMRSTPLPASWSGVLFRPDRRPADHDRLQRRHCL